MTADEIRSFDWSDYSGDEKPSKAIFHMLREIAAQLAELNAALALFLQNTRMVTYKPDTGVDTDE